MDITGKSVRHYAKESKLASIRESAEKIELPFSLDRDVHVLLRLLSTDGCLVDAIKWHIWRSKFIDFERWRDSDCFHVDEQGPQGKLILSYGNFLLIQRSSFNCMALS